VVTNAYLNSASSLFVMKLQGTVVDLLVSPLSYAEILGAFVAAAVARGLVVGGIMWVVGALFTGFGLVHPLLAAGLLVLVASGFAALGFLTATWAASFEQVNFLPTFVVTPLTFLGGVFYSAAMAPPALRWLTRANPIYYLVESLRWAVLGRADAPPGAGFLVAGALAAGGLAAAYAVLRSGWRLRG
jgi:ABC-2 type transport system permease protein